MAATFTILDYCLFIAILVASALIGVYYMLQERWQARRATAEDILMGGRDMGVFPVAMSLLASYMSAITVLGIPTEIYVYGISYWLVALAGFFTFPVTCFVFLPFFHGLELSSAYEYLELRFNRTVRYLASILFVIQMMMYMAVVLYAPALALNQVTGLSLFGSILAVGIVVTFYTSMGGLKAVVWTDTFQTFVVVAGLIGVVAIGSQRLGGLRRVWEIANKGGRTEFFKFDPSPFERTTFWSVTVGSFVGQMTIYGASQTMLQRYLSIKDLRASQVALFISFPATTILVSVVCLSGLVIYATYQDCDPLLAGGLLSRDQLLPYFVMENLGSVKGVPGVFVSCVFAAALSSISSCLNALSITVLNDLVKPSMSTSMTPKLESFLAKGLGVLNGALIIGLAFLCYFIGSTVLQVMLTALGAGGGPLLGLFLLGMFFPCVNSIGAISGLVTSTFVTFWIAIGAIVKRIPQATLPLTTKGCKAQSNVTEIFNYILQLYSATPVSYSTTPGYNNELVERNPRNDHATGGFDVIYSLSFLWYPTLALFIALTVGILVSGLTGWTSNYSGPIDSRLIYPAHNRLCCLVPYCIRRWFSCGELWTFNVGSTDLYRIAVDSDYDSSDADDKNNKGRKPLEDNDSDNEDEALVSSAHRKGVSKRGERVSLLQGEKTNENKANDGKTFYNSSFETDVMAKV